MPDKNETKETIEIPDKITVTYDKGIISMKGSKGETSRLFVHPKLKITVQNGAVEIGCIGKAHRKERALVGTYQAHLRNMFKGVNEGFTYTMKTVFSHFPIKASIDKNTFIIQNFLGERSPRHAEILENVKVEIKGDQVILTGIDREKIGQTAANIERATKVKNRDIRVFQDGIYLISTRG